MAEQLPSDQRPATPNYLDPSPDCVCGHEEADHVGSDSVLGETECLECSFRTPCSEYRPKDDYYYEELRQEAMLAKWEDR